MKHESRKHWSELLSEAGQERGFFSQLGDEHAALFASGNGSLVVTFDNLDDARQGGDGRLPWGTEFVTSQGWSSLGLMAHGWTWYRDPNVYKFFDKLEKEGFFRNFDRVIFYGTSMGGYAATAFSSAAPGADVLALSPQSTLDRDICTGWEPRFVKAWRRDFKGPYGFGPHQVASANKVFVLYDPLVLEDAMHATLYRGENVQHIPCARFGHNLGSTLGRMKLLKPIVQGVVDDTLTKAQIYSLLRARRTMPFYQKLILQELLEEGKPMRIHDYCAAVLARSEDVGRPRFRKAMDAAARKMGNR